MQVNINIEVTTPAELQLLGQMLTYASRMTAKPVVVDAEPAAPPAPPSADAPPAASAAAPSDPAVAGDVSGGVKKTRSRKKAEPAPEKSAADMLADMQAKEPAPAAAPAASPSTAPTTKEIRTALEKYSAAKGLPAAVAVFARFGAKGISEIPEERRAELLEALSL